MSYIERINLFFGRYASWSIRHRWAVLLCTLVAIIAIGFGLPRFRTSSSFESYFLENDPMLVKTREFKDIFGNDNYVALLVESDSLFSHGTLTLLRELTEELKDSVSYADKMTALTDMEFMSNEDGVISIEQLVPDEIPTAPIELANIRAKLETKPETARRIISSDGCYTWVLLKLRPFPPSDSDEGKGCEMLTGGEVEKIITKDKYTPLNIRAAGLPYLNYSKTIWVNHSMQIIESIAILLAIIMLLVVTRTWRGVVLPIVTSVLSVVMMLGTLGYCGYETDSMMLIIPILTGFTLPISYSVHVFTFFRRSFLRHGERKRAVVETMCEMAWPVSFSALTTIAALLTFLFVPVKPLNFVGIGTALSLLFACILIALLFPTIMSFGRNRKVVQQTNDEVVRRSDIYMQRWGHAVLRRGWLIFCLGVGLTAFFLAGSTMLQTAFDVEATMGRRVPYVKKLLELAETEIGTIYSYDILVDFPNPDDAKQPEHLRQLDSLEHYILKLPLTKRTTSVLSVLKDLNRTINDNAPDAYCIPSSSEEVAQLLLLYENAGGSEVEYWVDYDYQKLRISVEMHTYNSGIAEQLTKQIEEEAKILIPDAHVQVVGTVPQFTTMMQYVVRGQMLSFFLSLFIIMLILMIVFRSVKIALVGMIPNVLPGIVVAGIMGWFNIPLDMMTATIIPIVLGISVDDTIQFINHCHLEFYRKGNYNLAIERSFKVTGIAMIFSTVVLCCNFGTYIISPATSIWHMGVLCVAGLTTALVADLTFTPLLCRKFKVFGREIEQEKEA